MAALGAAVTVIVLLAVLMQPAALVTVTLYCPAKAGVLMVAVVAVKPPGPVQLYATPTVVAVNTTLAFPQTLVAPVTVATVGALTEIFLLAVAVQPPALVTVTLYKPAIAVVALGRESVLLLPVFWVKPPGPLHW
jgi:hypothetical protein